MHTLLLAIFGAVGFLVVILALYIGGNWLLALLRKPKPPSEESVRTYSERLLSPRWEELEEYFGRPIPERIKHFYTQTEIISRRDIRVRSANGRIFHVAQFLPADTETLNRTWLSLKESANFPLATDSFGDCYHIPLAGEKSELCPVVCYHHDGSDFESVSTSLDEFLNGIEVEIR